MENVAINKTFRSQDIRWSRTTIFHHACKLMRCPPLPHLAGDIQLSATTVFSSNVENQINEMLSLDREMRLPFVDVAMGYSSFDKY